MLAFYSYFQSRLAGGGFSTEDTLASFLPLLRQVIETHAAQKVAPLDGLDALRVEGVRIWFPEDSRQEIETNHPALAQFERKRQAVEVVEDWSRSTDLDEAAEQLVNRHVGERGAEITRPIYLPDYVTWEHEIGHHDPLTDVMSLGLLLASLACGLDLHEQDDLNRFAAHRRNLFRVNADLHPVIAQAIVRMTELDRHARAADLSHLLGNLENYRDQAVDLDIELARVDGFEQQALASKHQIVLGKLQERLFEISRRNRLLHFRATLQTVNLTQASVPVAFDPESIRADQILTWNDNLQQLAVSGQPISLNKYLNFREALYLPGVLDQIRAEASRDEKEFGFAQLRLVPCFLRWANLKEDPPERFDSPLVLLPAKLVKKKGIRDTYHLELLSTLAEVNPVVRHQFKQLYDIDLPETWDLEKQSLEQLYDFLADKVQGGNSAVTLEKVDRPRIDLIHDQARRRLDQYRRNARIGGRGVRTFGDVEYSYDPANYHPLGLKLFDRLIRPPSTRIREILSEHPQRRQYATEPKEEAVTQREKRFYHLREGDGDDNPFAWEFDLCSVTLGNFKYRKMSLVRDYAALHENELENPAFDAVFSLVPRPLQEHSGTPPPFEQRYHVVPCDPTQAAAVARADSQQSYIIQGPPGTGKSQTITNLIADYVARGKRVLFVCEKRAAIDVVYLRLRQQGLDELCCLIHDSQADKKEFVMNLKQTYETFLKEAADPAADLPAERKRHIRQLTKELAPLSRYSQAMTEQAPLAGCSLRALIDRACEFADQVPPLSPLERERLPALSEWEEHAATMEAVRTAIDETCPDGLLCRHPLHRLDCRLSRVERPLERITANLEGAAEAIDRICQQLQDSAIEDDASNSPAKLEALVRYAEQVGDLVRQGHADLIDSASRRSDELREELVKIDAAQRQLSETQSRTKYWREKLPPQELEIARATAQRLEGRPLRFLQPAWWRLRSILARCYDFSQHVIKPGWTQVFDALHEEYRAADALESAEAAARQRFAYREAADGFVQRLESVRQATADLPPQVAALHAAVLAGERAELIEMLISLRSELDRLLAHCDAFLEHYRQQPFGRLTEMLEQISAALDQLPDFMDVLSHLAALPAELREVVLGHPYSVRALEAAVTEETLRRILQADRSLNRFSAAQRDKHAVRLEKAVGQWYEINARVVRNRARDVFLEKIRITSQAAGELAPEHRELKKQYDRGRKELEHEFGKKMRYKSIRDLVSDESGVVVRDLKPIWLMSPLSVSDTLPLDTDCFDVVIFDEASQITLEEAIPSIFRATQTIVVGDEMQLPPTNFFSAKRSGEEEQVVLGDGEEQVPYDLDAGSLLSHAARNLASTMLGWHYRSRSESLISFSNWAFYGGRLLTVPEEQTSSQRLEELAVADVTQGADNVAQLLARPVSFHFLENGIYERRRNRQEADYIAQLVRGLLLGGSGMSIGVVAFSEAQQSEIEQGLARLAEDDPAFRDALDAEWEREEEGQFVGLLVKNLENIQGDERDVVIMSVCYGYNRQGEMRMNFGPINVSGGEKRLNVAFSRAKHHMALVSSIRASDVKNDYNDGANCLKNYLRYAEASSRGNAEAAERLLREIAVWRGAAVQQAASREDTVTRQVADALRERGYLVDLEVGQSHFRCNVAVRCEGDRQYRLGILIDTRDYYRQEDLLERELMKPKLLRDFGWRIAHVLAKQWYQDREEVLTRLEELLNKANGREYPEPIAAARGQDAPEEVGPESEPHSRPNEKASTDSADAQE